MTLKTRLMHIAAGDIRGLVMDVIGGSVNGMATGATKLGTVNGVQIDYARAFSETGMAYDFCPLLVRVSPTAQTGSISTPTTLTIGTNSPNYDNLAGPILLTGLTALGLHTVAAVGAAASVAVYGADVFCNVTIAATGIGATLVFEVALIGAMSSNP